MDAVEYLKQLKRMCKDRKCNECPLYKKIYAFRPCVPYAIEDEKMTVEIVEKWAKEHPVKTRMDKLLEAFPNADVYDGYPDICPGCLDRSYKKVKCNEKANCTDCEREYWTEEIE